MTKPSLKSTKNIIGKLVVLSFSQKHVCIILYLFGMFVDWLRLSRSMFGTQGHTIWKNKFPYRDTLSIFPIQTLIKQFSNKTKA